VIIVDPPQGWRYGFPKPCPDFSKANDNKAFEDWLVSEGYPQKLIDEGMSKYCRYWEDTTNSA